MKKISSKRLSDKAINLIFCVLSLTFAIISFSGCELEFVEEEVAAAPQVNTSSAGIALTIPKYTTTTKYINIYRRDVTGKAKNKRDNLPYEKIGIVNPDRFVDDNGKSSKNCFYEDVYIYKDHTYQYCVRYSSDKTKVSSYWSNDISPKSTAGLSESENFSYNIKDVFYDEANKSFYFSTNITIQDSLKEFTPRIIISNGTKDEIFDIPASLLSEKTIIGGQSSSISLLGLLPPDYLSTDKETINITIRGLIGEKLNYANNKTNTDSQGEVLSKTWTPLTAINLKDRNGKPITSFSVLSTSGLSGDDWTDL